VGRCPSNLAVAVGPDITYVTVESGGRRAVMSLRRGTAWPAYEKERFGGAEKAEPRSEDRILLGRRYQPLFD